MTAASGMFGVNLVDVYDATQLAMNLVGDACKLSLHTNTMTPDFNAWDFYADLTNEVTGTGYTATGVTLASKTVAVSAGFVVFDFTDPAWTTATISSVRQGVYYDDTLASDPLVCCNNFGSDFSVTAGTLTVVVHANGYLRVDIIP
jgi:hypothetical protein